MAVKMLATNELGFFRGIALRSAICEAMVSRDLDKLSTAVRNLELSAVDGGLAIVYGKKLESELTRLKYDWETLNSAAKHYEYLALVELFLMECGRLGYRGTEMFAAVELRQTLMTQVCCLVFMLMFNLCECFIILLTYVLFMLFIVIVFSGLLNGQLMFMITLKSFVDVLI